MAAEQRLRLRRDLVDPAVGVADALVATAHAAPGAFGGLSIPPISTITFANACTTSPALEVRRPSEPLPVGDGGRVVRLLLRPRFYLTVQWRCPVSMRLSAVVRRIETRHIALRALVRVVGPPVIVDGVGGGA